MESRAKNTMTVQRTICHILMICTVYIAECTSESKCRIVSHKDECCNQGLLWDCSQLNLEKIPTEFPDKLNNNTLMFDLSYNNFNSVSPKTFRGIHLNLSKITSLNFNNNRLNFVRRNSFKQLKNLCVLQFSSCNLKHWSFEDNSLSYLRKLRILTLNGNAYTSYPESELSSLLSLEILHIDVFDTFIFKEPFKRLKKLKEVKLFSTSHFHINNDSFSGLSESPIKYLAMYFKGHVLCDISEDIFCSFPYLKGVEMYFGGLCDMNVVMRSLKCLQNRTMDKIVANRNYLDFFVKPFYLNASNSVYLYSICVKNVDLYNNHISGIIANPHGTTMGNCIELLNIAKNKINIVDFSLAVDLLQNFPKLQFLDVSWNNKINLFMEDMSFHNISFQMQNSLKNIVTLTLPVSKELQVINYTKNYIHDIKIKDPFLLHINISGKNLRELYLSHTNAPISYIFGLDTPNLEVFDLSDNICTTVYPHIFEKATKLKKIFARNIRLSFHGLKSIFYNLEKLEELDLQRNNLHDIPPTLLKFQTSLSSLNLSSNFFSSFPVTLKYVQNLKVLNISFNKIPSLTETDFIVLKRLRSAKILLQGNPIICDCLHVQSLRRMKKLQHLFSDLNETICSEKNITVLGLLQEKAFVEFEKNCQTETWLAVSFSIAVIVIAAITIVFLLKKYHVHVDYIILSLRSRWKGMYSVESEDFQFDAFISYAEDDYRIVSTTLYQKLTQKGFQISFSDKDFIPGISKADELLRCIDKSRKVVFIITENFLTNGWNSYAVQMTVTHSFHNNRRQSIIVIIKDNITIQRMPKDLRYIWWSIVSIRWPETNELMEQFWDELDRALKSV